MKRNVLFALVLAWISATASAELKWDQSTLELHPGFGDKDAVGHFKYENTGKTPVRLKSVKTSCGCTVAKTEKEVVGPGEKGEITATFNIGGHVGTQVKTVTVQTDEPSSPTVLTLKAVIPEGLTLVPTFVYWKVGEEPKPKTIMAKTGKDYAVTKLSAECQNPEFSASVEPADAPGAWKIVVTPKQTQRNVATTITVKTEVPKG